MGNRERKDILALKKAIIATIVTGLGELVLLKLGLPGGNVGAIIFGTIFLGEALRQRAIGIHSK